MDFLRATCEYGAYDEVLAVVPQASVEAKNTVEPQPQLIGETKKVDPGTTVILDDAKEGELYEP